MQLVGDIKGDTKILMGKIDHEGGRKIPAEDFVWPGSGEVAFTGGGTAHHLDGNIEGKIQGFAQNGGFCRKRIERDAHVVVDELNADPHARTARVDQLTAHRHQDRCGAFNLFSGAASQQ